VTLSLSKGVFAAAAVAIALAGCSFQNKAEKEADKITHAVIANDMSPVINDFDSQARPKITRVAVARYADELNQQGKYKHIKEVQVPAGSVPGTHLFDVEFEKHMYTETMVLDDNGEVRSWNFHMKSAAPAP
ncbi:MAG: hypothetical protein M3N19_07780, partial [Candidatus Eremiobacteraeota bacterium]|nr:hypothetical protein [Candidatus Eremiobacteraeota bacterium]